MYLEETSYKVVFKCPSNSPATPYILMKFLPNAQWHLIGFLLCAYTTMHGQTHIKCTKNCIWLPPLQFSFLLVSVCKLRCYCNFSVSSHNVFAAVSSCFWITAICCCGQRPQTQTFSANRTSAFLSATDPVNGPSSSVGIAIDYGLEVPGSNPADG